MLDDVQTRIEVLSERLAAPKPKPRRRHLPGYRNTAAAREAQQRQRREWLEQERENWEMLVDGGSGEVGMKLKLRGPLEKDIQAWILASLGVEAKEMHTDKRGRVSWRSRGVWQAPGCMWWRATRLLRCLAAAWTYSETAARAMLAWDDAALVEEMR
jgi:hypothetical protein